jgi:hypothetical protein
MEPHGQTVAGNATLAVTATVTKADGGGVTGSLPWTVKGLAQSPLTLSLAGGASSTFSGGLKEGIGFEVVAGWRDGGPTATATYTVDVTPPTLDVIPDPVPVYAGDAGDFYPNDPDGPAWRRDEPIHVEISSLASDVDSSSLSLSASFGSEGSYAIPTGSPATCTSGNASRAFCRLYALDLSQVPMARFSGVLTVTAALSDLVGNASAPTTGSVRVTRWQWARQVDSAAGSSLKASPAVDLLGGVYLTSAASTSVFKVLPSGTSSSATSNGASDVSPAIGRSASGTEYVFYETTGAGGVLRAVGASTVCTSPGSTSPHGALAILNDGADSVLGVGMQAASTGSRVISLSPVNGDCPHSTTTVSSSVGFPGNFVSTGSNVYWADTSGTLRGASFSANAFTVMSASQSLGGVGIVSGLTLLDGGAKIAGGGGGPGIGRVFAYNTALSGSAWSAAASLSTPTSAPIVTASSVVAVVRSPSSLVQVIRLDSGDGHRLALSGELPTTSFGGTQVPSPVAGGDGQLYVLDDSGSLSVLPQAFADGVTSALWQHSLPPAIQGTTSSSPTIACNKRSPTSKTGVLYMATETGWLVSYLVDAKGLDTTAPWPKYGHDVRNTNNAGVTIEACP